MKGIPNFHKFLAPAGLAAGPLKDEAICYSRSKVGINGFALPER